MKHAKKLTALFIVLTLLLSLSATAFAEESYTITIEKGANGEAYKAYKIFDVTITENAAGFAYSISSESEWWGVVTGNTNPDAASSFTKNGLTFTKSTTDKVWIVEETSAFKAETFAALLADNVTGKTADATITSYSSSTKTMTVTALGYYFVDTTLGSLCSLDTTTTTGVSIYEKNVAPTIDKTVKENTDTDTDYGKTADANVGDTLNYKLVVNTGTKLVPNAAVDELPDGTGIDENYVIVDTLPAGITYTTGSIVVKNGDVVWTDTDYTVTYSDNKLTVTLLSTGKLKALATGTAITITYDAVLGTDFTKTSLNVANQNTVTLTYHNQTDISDAKVYTWSYDIIKYFDTDSNGQYNETDAKLENATFQISAEVDGSAINLVKVSANVYRPAVAGDTNKVTAITTDETGKLTLQGFDSGTYYLKETDAPDGYNKLDEVIKIQIVATPTNETDSLYSKDGNPAKVLTKTFAVGTETATNDATVYVENQTGAELPSTGGIGTTIFYVLGGLLAAGALVLLITNKRMKPEN